MGDVVSIFVKLKATGDQELSKLNKGLDNLNNVVDAGKASWAEFAAKAAAVTAAFAGVGLTIANVVGTFVQFDDTMRQVKGISGATAEEFDKMTATAKQMGIETRFTATNAAEALKYLSMAGLSAAESTKALPEVLNLAAAAGVDLGRSADILTNIMTGYGKTADDLVYINDSLVKTFTRSNTNLDELGQAFAYVGPVAKELGIRFNETATALGLLANAGYKGEKGGAALRNILTVLVAPTTNMSKLMDKLGVDANELGVNLSDSANALRSLGVQIKNSSGNMRPFRDILSDLRTKLMMIPDQADRAGVVMQIFGKRAGPAMAALLSQGSDAFRDLLDQIDNAGGTANDIANEMEAGLGGAIRALKSAIEGLVITIGDDLDTVLRPLIGQLVEFVRYLNEIDPATRILLEMIVAVTAAMLAWKLVLIPVAAVLSEIVVVPIVAFIGTVVSAVEAATVAFVAAGTAISALPIVFLASAAAWAAIKIWNLAKAIYEWRKAVGLVSQAEADKNEVIETTGKAADEQARKVGERLGIAVDNMKDLFKAADEGRIVWNDATNQWELATKVLNKQSGQMELTKAEMKTLQNSLKDLGSEYDRLRTRLSAYYDFEAQKAEALARKDEDAARITMQIYKDKADAMIQLAQEEARKKEEILAASGASERQQSEESIKIAESLRDAKIKALSDWESKLQSALLKAIADEQKYAEQVKQLHERLHEVQAEGADRIRELNRKLMSEEQAWMDKRSQAYETLAQAQTELSKGTEEGAKAAEELFKKAESQFAGLATEVKNGDQTVRSLADTTAEATNGITQAVEGQKKAIQEQISLTEEAQRKRQEDIQKFQEQLDQVKSKITEINTTPINPKATIQVDSKAVDAKLAELNKTVTHSTHIIHVQTVQESRWGGMIGAVQRFAEGGWNRLSGKLAGFGGGDRVRALLEAGEFIIRKEAVQKYGAGLFYMLNNLRLNFDSLGELLSASALSVPEIPKLAYATGGPVAGAEDYGTLTLAAGDAQLPVIVPGPNSREMVQAFERELAKMRLTRGRT